MQRYASQAVATLLLMGAGTAAAQNYSISGTVTAPKGVDVSGTQVVACSVPYQQCKTEVSTKVDASGNFTLKMPGSGPYQVLAVKDVNSDGQGEYLVAARDGAAIKAPVSGLDMALWQAGKEHASATSNADVPALAGNWSQSSTKTELALVSTIKQMASSSVGFGTDLGGTFGPGSATNSVIVTESKPLPVSRQMNLAILPDGTYRWNITKSMPDGKCTKTVKQEKFGRVLTDQNKITFATENGTESWSSCGKSGSGKISKSHETYNYTRNGNTLSVEGPNVDWAFRRS